MPNSHITGVFDAEGAHFQAICSCGWLSTISFLEEVDLLRAMHAHEVSVFGDRKWPRARRDVSGQIYGYQSTVEV